MSNSDTALIDPVTALVPDIFHAVRRAIVFDDDKEDREYVATGLESSGWQVDTVANLRSFNELLRQKSFNVAAMDNCFYGVDNRDSFLPDLRKRFPSMGQVVHSASSDKEAKSIELGADAFVSKLKSMPELQAAMGEVLQIGYLRQLEEVLRELGYADFPVIEAQSLAEAEKFFYEKSRYVALTHLLNYKGDAGLRKLLNDRGWWQSMDKDAYAKRKKYQKLNQLIDYVKASHAEISQIIGIPELEVDKYLSQGQFDTSYGQNVLDAFDRLLSVLAYILRLTVYEPELMPHFWRVKDYFKNNYTQPPWDDVGLAEYLKTQKHNGLTTALYWIRSH